MTERDRLLQSIALTIQDYQAGFLPTPDSGHVDKWISQFNTQFHLPILAEIDHALSKSYFSKQKVVDFMRCVIDHSGWNNGKPLDFWKEMNFLSIQPRGNSQKEFLKLFENEIFNALGLSFSNCGGGNKFLYLDDGLFSGGRIGTDLESWITNNAPQDAQLFVAMIACHTQGLYFTNKKLEEVIANSGKNIKIFWGYKILVEDGIFENKVNNSDVLRPLGAGDNPRVATYLAGLGKDQLWRVGNGLGSLGFFSSPQGRDLLEQAFLVEGLTVRDMCPLLIDYQRPLGNTRMRTLGFGTLFSTYRNCPNNAPLVLWAGAPWYPLLPRITN